MSLGGVSLWDVTLWGVSLGGVSNTINSHLSIHHHEMNSNLTHLFFTGTVAWEGVSALDAITIGYR